MRSLNRRYRGKDRTTDVLSFPMREGRFSRVRQELLGDIVICMPVAARQARSAGGTFREEIDRLLVHGLLHLLGYDHERGRKEARRMEARERSMREALER
jgi:probable rRNA maturation factor